MSATAAPASPIDTCTAGLVTSATALCVDAQASKMYHACFIGPLCRPRGAAGGGEQHLQGPGSICKDLPVYWPNASMVRSVKAVGITWPMRCKNCSGVDRSATDLSGSSTYAFSFLVSSSLGAICMHQSCQTSCQLMRHITWSSSVSAEADAYTACMQRVSGHSICLLPCLSCKQKPVTTCMGYQLLD